MPEEYLFIAKSDPIETLKEHTGKLLILFKKFKEIYGGKFSEKELELIEMACKYHDLGKISSGFQNEIKKNINRKNKKEIYEFDLKFEDIYKALNITQIPHGILSCAFLDIDELEKKFNEEEINILVSSIYHHHKKILQDNNKNRIGTDVVKKIIDSDLKYYYKFYDSSLTVGSLGVVMNAISEVGLSERIKDKYEFWKKFIVVKGMLNKLDYAASGGLTTLEITPNDAAECVEIKFKKEKWEIKDCQAFMKNNSDKNLVIVASTGIGKTEGALLWAGSAKTFYTLPIKVSINAIYERIKYQCYYGESKEDKEKVTFLHSDTKSMMMKEDEKNKKDDNFKESNLIENNYKVRYLQSRQLSYPLTVCTIDQLFYFVFKSLGTERFPATLKYSKVIIDEIQSYTADITAFIIYGLKVVNDLGGKFLIMTATLPPVVKHFLVEEIGEENIKIEERPFFKKDSNKEIIKRHFIKYIEKDFNYEEIVNQSKIKKVLVICNTVKRAQNVYTEIKNKIQETDNKNKIDINLLHSRFILKERKKKEKKILEFASNDKDKRNDKKGIWISTQIVEASLDIDFDILYTDMTTADSLLQRMGRCFRDRSYNEKTPNIFIYKIDDEKSIGVGSVYDKDIFNFSAECINKYSGGIFGEEDKIKYIDEVYDTEKVKHTKYYEAIEKNLKDLGNLTLGGVDNATTERKFRDINNITVIPANFYNELEKEKKFEKYEEARGEEKLKIKNEILNYTTSVGYYLIKDKNFINYKGLDNISITYLKYDEEYGLSNLIDDELEVTDRCC